jgi:caffeoyl-CoA O-methyltransferase
MTNLTIAAGTRITVVAGVTIAPAVETLDNLIADGQSNSFDFAFIDADKENYVTYYEQCLKLLRQGGVVGVDNTLWGGAVADPNKKDADTVAIRALILRVFEDKRVDSSLLPIGDGLYLARKR